MNEENSNTIILALCRKLISNMLKDTIEKRYGTMVVAEYHYESAYSAAAAFQPSLAVVEIPERKTASVQGAKAKNAEADVTEAFDLLKVCHDISDGCPGCKIILICPEKDTESVNECVEAKQRGYIDEFLFFDATSDYLVSKIEALIGEPENNAGSNESEELLTGSFEPTPAKAERKPLKYKAAYISAAACLIVICGVLIATDVVGWKQDDPNISNNPVDHIDPGDPVGSDVPVEIDDRHIPLAAPLFPDVNAVPYEVDSDSTVGVTVGTVVGTADGPWCLIPDYDGKAITVSNGRYAQITLFNQVSNPCSLTFEIVLADTGKSLYKSGLVAPGMCLENVELDEILDAHEYSAVLIISAYDSSNLEIMDNTRMEITLTPSP